MGNGSSLHPALADFRLLHLGDDLSDHLEKQHADSLCCTYTSLWLCRNALSAESNAHWIAAPCSKRTTTDVF